MTVPVVSVPADVTIDTVIERYFAHHLYTTFPVVNAQGLFPVVMPKGWSWGC